MNLRNFPAALAMLGLLTLTPGCKDFYDVNVDPLHPSTATEGQILPGTQVAMGTYLGFSLQGLGQATSTLVGQLNSSRGIGAFQQSGGSFGNQWSGLYNDMLANNEIIIRQASANGNKTFLGIAQLQKAYVFSQMVDMWGDIPYSQALKGIDNRTPRFDDDRDIYLGNPGLGIQGLFSLIDEGIANLTVGGGASAGGVDLIYNGDASKWVRFGNTLKLKLYNQIAEAARLNPTSVNVDVAAQVAPLLVDPLSLIRPNEDFELPYGNSIQPENRNINYLANYVNPGREDFINQDFYQFMIDRRDPRMNFYFYNQRNTLAEGIVDYKIDKPGGIFPPVNGAFGTVRLGSSGPLASAASAENITLPGLYPSGGRYNDGAFGLADNRYARGLVAQRMLTKFARHFIEAELHLTVLKDNAGAALAARAAYEAGIKEAFRKVNTIGQAEGTPTALPTLASPAAIPAIDPDGPITPVLTLGVLPYITRALARYDAAGNNEAKLNVVMQEKYVASFGFGEDIYTDYRRTGYPNVVGTGVVGNLATIIRGPGDVPGTVSTGSFPSILFYTNSDLTLNPNAPAQHLPGDKVFWDVK